jgi:ferritin-like metal-binding protein YciE
MPNHITAETHRRETKERLVRIETIVDRMEVHLNKLNDRTGKL